MTTNSGPGGVIPPDNRGPQAKGVGKNSKRHDLERRSTPFLHDSDLQQGDVQALEQGQRIAPRQQQRPAANTSRNADTSQNREVSGGSVEVPDPIDFLAERSQGLELPAPISGASGGKFASWQGIINQIVSGPGSSPILAEAFIAQMRALRQTAVNRPTTIIDMEDAMADMEAMLEEGI